jgi:hypothetical protein
MQGFNTAFPASAGDLLDLERSFSERSLVGGTARATVESALAEASKELDAAAAWIAETETG